jgi:hypothetical protein
MKSAFVVLLFALAPLSAVHAQSTEPDQIANDLHELTNRLTIRGRHEFNIWHSERYDTVNAALMVYVCADYRYAEAQLGQNRLNVAAQSALGESRNNARQGVFDYRAMLYRSVLEKLRSENLADAALIAGGAAESFTSYAAGYDAALRRTWRQNADQFEADCR